MIKVLTQRSEWVAIYEHGLTVVRRTTARDARFNGVASAARL
jgi:hypothetical protein